MTTTHQTSAPRRTRWDTRNDDGSLLLVILFTVMMTALVLVATATMITGLAKTRNTRDYSIASQAADTAFADALIQANLGKFGPTAVSPRVGPIHTLGSVTWKWTATRTTPSGRTWDIDVEAKGKSMNRHFSATLKGSQVTGGVLNTNSDQIRYIVDRTEYYEHGFFGIDRVTVVSGTPEFDGYNGESGTVGSNGPLALGTASLDRINEWAWTSDTGRCTGTACAVAKVSRLKQQAFFGTGTIITECADAADTYGDWTASSGALLVSGGCYNSLNFNATRASFNLTEPVYVKAGGVTVAPGVNINTGATTANAKSGTLRIATLGGFTQGTGSKIAMAVYAPNGVCQTTAAVDTLYQTLWSGAATCKTLQVTGNARLRYDGGLDIVNDAKATTTGKWVYSLYDYQSLD